MSRQDPSNPVRRRRIAGERRTTYPPDGTREPSPETVEAVETEKPSDRSVLTRDQDQPDKTGKARPEKAKADSASRGVPLLVLAVLAVLGVLAALAVGLAAYFWTQASEAEAVARAQVRAPAAAERAAQAVLSYDHESLEADKEKAARFLTDGYRSDYVDTFESLVAPNAEEVRAKVEAGVVASSVMLPGQDTGPQHQRVLLFVDQTTTSTATGGEPSTALNRVVLDMVEVDDTWLVDGITSY